MAALFPVFVFQECRQVHVHEPGALGEAASHGDLNASFRKCHFGFRNADPNAERIAVEMLDEASHGWPSPYGHEPATLSRYWPDTMLAYNYHRPVLPDTDQAGLGR